MKPTQVVRTFALFGLAAALATGSVAAADRGITRVYTLTPSTHGNPEGVASAGNGTFFVGATRDGAIYRGTLDDPNVQEFIPGAPGKSAIGLKVSRGRLYVAGGATGTVVVYDLGSRRQVASFATGAGGFLNDLVVTGNGDVFVTDSFRPTLWRITAAQVRAGTGTPEAISVAPEITFQAGAFNLNGIVALDEHTLVVVQSSNGALFRVELDRHGRRIQQIAVEPVLGGDGLLLDRGRLVVVQGSPAQLTFIELDRHATRGAIVAHRTDSALRGPSTVARALGRYLVVNADFATDTVPFTLAGLARGADGDGDGDDDDDDDDH